METVSNGKFGNWSCSELAYWFRFRLTTRHDQTVYSRVASAVWTALSLQLPTNGTETGTTATSQTYVKRDFEVGAVEQQHVIYDPRHAAGHVTRTHCRRLTLGLCRHHVLFCEIEIKRLPLIKSILQTTQKHNQARSTPTTAYKSTNGKVCHTPQSSINRVLISVPLALKTATPDLRLPSQPYSIAAI